MKRFGKWMGRVLGLLFVLLAGLWLFGPREPVDVVAKFEPRKFGEGVQVYLESTESVFDNIRTDNEKQVVWAQGAERRTKYSVVYLHGFSASAQEIRPVPDQVARALGANLYFARFAGHGRDGAAMAGASVQDWMYDTAEALAVGRAIGDEVIVIATSTGGTIAAVAALDAEMSEGVKGFVLIAPNFGVNNWAAPMMTWPAARYWLPLLVGDSRSFEPRGDGQAAHWTTSYPSVALLPMAAIVKYAVAQDYSGLAVPVLFMFSDADKVVRADVTRAVAGRWGGPVTLDIVTPRDGVDVYNHVITGQIMSPGNIDPVVNAILSWIGEL